MSAEYEGTIVQNEQYKVKKLVNHIRALEATNAELNNLVAAMTAEYTAKTDELKAQIKRFINNGIQLPKGRPRVKPITAPKPRGGKKGTK